MLLLISCTTTQPATNNPAPFIKAPDPIVNGVSVVEVYKEGSVTYTVVDKKTGQKEPKVIIKHDFVVMPSWYFLKLTRYVIDTQAVQKIHNLK